MINKFFLLLHTFFLLTCLQACEKIEQKNNITETKHLNHSIKNDVKKNSQENEIIFDENYRIEKKIDYKEDNIIIKFDNKKIVIFTNNENPILSYYKKNNQIGKDKPIDFDYTYSEDINSATDKIKLLFQNSNKNNNIILVTPITTDENPRYNIIYLNENGVMNNVLVELSDLACENFNKFIDDKNSLYFANEQTKCLLSIIPDKKNNENETKIDNTEKIRFKKIVLENFTENNFDFNQDGLIDKISLTKPAEMDDRNFNATIKILKNIGDGYQKFAENALMLEEPTSGCGLDGLQEIWGDENNLNIIYQDCIDRKFATRSVSFAFDDVLNDFILIKNEIEFSDADGNSISHACEVMGIGFSEFDGSCY